ncbi:MAG: M56 family metallopeptidase [Planctomycetales bacterium]
MATLLQFGLVNAAVVAGLAALVVCLEFRLRRPALVHALWILVLAKLAVPPLVQIPFTLPAAQTVALQAGATQSGDQTAATESANPQSASDPRAAPLLANSSSGAARDGASESAAFWERITSRSGWNAWWGARLDAATLAWRRHDAWLPAVLCGLWGGGALLWFSRQAFRIHRFQRRLATAVPAPPEIQAQADQLARRLGLRYAPEVLVAAETISPMLCGVGSRLRLVFPEALLERLDDEARDSLLAHELAHFGRGDHWVRLLELVITGLYWWHPVVWWARRRLEATEEECCDAWVINRLGSPPRVYAEALLNTVDFLAESPLPLPPGATGAGQAQFLRSRLVQIMRGVSPQALSRRGRWGVVVLALAVLPLHLEFTRAAPTDSEAQDFAAAPQQQTSKKRRKLSPPEVASRTGSMPSRFRNGMGGSRGGLLPPRELSSAESAEVSGEADADWSVATSADGRFSVMRQGKRRVVLYDSQRDLTTDLSAARIRTVEFSPEGRQFATGGADAVVRIWDASTGRQSAQLELHQEAVQSVAYCSGGAQLVSATKQGEIVVWNLAARQPRSRWRSKRIPIQGIAVAPDGQTLAVASGQGTALDPGGVTLTDLSTLEVRQFFPASSLVGGVAFHDDGRSLVAGEWSGKVTVWDLETLQMTAVGYIPRELIGDARFSRDTQALSQLDLQSLLPASPAPTAEGQGAPYGLFGGLPEPPAPGDFPAVEPQSVQ